MNKLTAIFTIALCLGSSIALGLCETQESTVLSKPRFLLNAGEVFDQKTKLNWYRCSVGSVWVNNEGCVGKLTPMTLMDAREYAGVLGNGWRVPSINELYSLVEQECVNPVINAEVFPDIKEIGEGAPYWSDTQIEEIPSLYYYLDFINGDVDGHSINFPLAVRFVREQP